MSNASPKRLSPFVRSGLDLGPLILFFVAVRMADIFTATAVFMGAIAMTLAAGFILERRLSPMALITAAIVLVFGGLTLYLHDKTFIKLKPTIIYAIFALILSAGALTGRNFLKNLFDHVFHMPEDCWRALTWRWVVFFVFMAVLNEVVWRNFSDAAWAGFKLFGALPLTFLFALAQSPFILKHQIEGKAGDLTRGALRDWRMVKKPVNSRLWRQCSSAHLTLGKASSVHGMSSHGNSATSRLSGPAAKDGTSNLARYINWIWLMCGTE